MSNVTTPETDPITASFRNTVELVMQARKQKATHFALARVSEEGPPHLSIYGAGSVADVAHWLKQHEGSHPFSAAIRIPRSGDARRDRREVENFIRAWFERRTGADAPKLIAQSGKQPIEKVLEACGGSFSNLGTVQRHGTGGA